MKYEFVTKHLKKNLNCDEHKKYNCVQQQKTIFFFYKILKLK